MTDSLYKQARDQLLRDLDLEKERHDRMMRSIMRSLRNLEAVDSKKVKKDASSVS